MINYFSSLKKLSFLPSLVLSLAATLAGVLPISAQETAEAAFFHVQGAEAGEARIWAGIHYRSDITAGAAIGKAVAEKVTARPRTDGAQ